MEAETARVPRGLETATASSSPQRQLIKVYMKQDHSDADVEGAAACFTQRGIRPEIVKDDQVVVQGLTQLDMPAEARIALRVCLHEHGNFAPS